MTPDPMSPRLMVKVWRSLASAWRWPHDGPAWAPWVWTLLLNTAIALAITRFAAGGGGGLAWNLVVSQSIGLSIHALFLGLGRLLHLDLFTLPLRLRLGFVAAVVLAGSWIGSGLSMLLLTRDPDRALALLQRAWGGMVLIPLISAVIIVAVLAAASRLRAGQLAAERARSETIRAEREAIAARLALLNAQIEPHFLYNTLAHVRVLAGTDAPAAQRMLDSLIDYLRASSRNMVLPLVTLSQELESVRGYLAVMQQRLGDRLTVVWRVPEQAGDQVVPPAALQTLVENAIKHGIEPAAAGGEIRIEAMPGDGGWLIEVSDTGAGFSSPAATRLGTGTSDRGTGLANLSERLRLTMGGLAGVALDRLTGTTRARLQLGPANRAAP